MREIACSCYDIESAAVSAEKEFKRLARSATYCSVSVVPRPYQLPRLGIPEIDLRRIQFSRGNPLTVRAVGNLGNPVTMPFKMPDESASFKIPNFNIGAFRSNHKKSIVGTYSHAEDNWRPVTTVAASRAIITSATRSPLIFQPTH